MAKITIKQYDITDSGAACLASISAYYKLQIPISVKVLNNNEVTYIFGGSYFLKPKYLQYQA